MYHDEHAIAETNQITDTLTSTKVGKRPKTPEKGLQNKTYKKLHILRQLLEVWEIWPFNKRMSKQINHGKSRSNT